MVYLSRQVRMNFKGESANVCICLWCDAGGRGLNKINNQQIGIIHMNAINVFFSRKASKLCTFLCQALPSCQIDEIMFI